MSESTDLARLEGRFEQLVKSIHESIDGVATAVRLEGDRNEQRVHDSEDRLRAELIRVDKRINGSVANAHAAHLRLEGELLAIKLVEARKQGAAEAREQHGLPADALPPPVTTTKGEQPVSKLTSNFVAVAGGLAVLLGGIAAVIGHA